MTIYAETTVDLYQRLPLTIITAKQGDTGRGFLATITAGDEIPDFSGATVAVYIKKPDGTKIYNACTADGNVITGELTNQALAVPGDAEVELQAQDGGDILSTPIFTLRVLPSNIDDTAIQSSNEFTELRRALYVTGALGICSPVTLNDTYVTERVPLGFTRAGSLANITLQLSTATALTSGSDYVIASDFPAPLSDVAFSVEMEDSGVSTVGHAWIEADGTDLHFSPAANMTSGADLDINITYMVQYEQYGPQPSQEGQLTDEIKDAILAMFQHVAFSDDEGQTYYDALYDAMYPTVTVTSISAVFNQGLNPVYDTDTLDSLKTYLTVTAFYDDGSSATVAAADYTLSGTLEVGTSTITVTYEECTDDFTVTVTANPNPLLHSWDFTQSLDDSVGGVTAVLSTASLVRDSTGLHFNAVSQACDLGLVMEADTTMEVDFAEFDMINGHNTSTNHTRMFMVGSNPDGSNGILIRSRNGITVYKDAWWSSYYSIPAADMWTFFANKTVSIYIDSDGYATLKVDGVSYGKAGKAFATSKHWFLGNNSTGGAGANFYDCTITGVRIYSGDK